MCRSSRSNQNCRRIGRHVLRIEDGCERQDMQIRGVQRQDKPTVTMIIPIRSARGMVFSGCARFSSRVGDLVPAAESEQIRR